MKRLITLAFVLSGVAASAQEITGDSIKAQFVRDWQRAEAYTQSYLNTMPADKYSFKAVDSIRSFAQQMLHLATGNAFLISTATGEKPDFLPPGNLETRESAQSKDSVMYYVTKSYDFAVASIEKLSPSQYGEVVGGRVKVTRFAWLLKAFEHQTHHRGQCTIYIRLQGIRPPNERLF